jgi:hypothetical protein
MAMKNNGSYKTVVIEDGRHAVVRTESRTPHLLEIIAIFYDAARAREYADLQGSRGSEEQPETALQAVPESVAKPPGNVSGLSERQLAVLKALQTRMDADNLVAAKATELAGAARIPLGSLHSVLQSLERKQFIKAVRAGTARVPALYQVL